MIYLMNNKYIYVNIMTPIIMMIKICKQNDLYNKITLVII